MDKRNIVGSRVATQRQRQGMTQTDLMSELNKEGVEITRTAVTKLETGFRCVRDYEVVALAKILKTTPQYLLTGRK
ncbi:MAG: helix-turn-helix transcriptional regulator [Kiritimatiellaeota bacterium]|nr:helix-turn-helix transcriptional regulator [Kiritimatiellota bacterium]